MKRFSNSFICIMLAVVSGLLATGCGGGPKEGVLPLASALRISDIPVPKGFSFKAKESWDTSDRDERRVQHVYSGGPELNQVAEFYRTQLPSYGWQVNNETFDRGTHRFTCSKKGENCVVSAWREWYWTTKIMIQLFPTAGK